MGVSITAALGKLFQHPKWGLNWLFMSIAILIPLIGPLIVIGYMLYCFVAWLDGREEPEFSFERFGEYLQRGLWPFLANLVVGFAIVPILLVAAVPMIAAMVSEEPVAVVGGIVFFFAVELVLILVISVVMVPVLLGSGLTQSFGGGFRMAFLSDFLRKVGWLALGHIVLLMVAGTVLSIVGMLALIVGMYFAMAWLTHASYHLYFQLYRLHLERGGMELPVHPSLRPPNLPPATLPPPLAPQSPPPLPRDL